MLASLATWEDAEPLKLRFLKTPAWSQTCAQEGEIVSWLMTSITVGRKEKGREKRTVRSSTRVWLRMNPIVCARALLQELRNMFSCMDMF